MSDTKFLERVASSLRQPLRLGRLSPTGCDAFDYNLGQPNLFLLMRFKQALKRRFGVRRGFEIYRETIKAQSHTRLSKRRLASQLTFCQRKSLFFEELAPAGHDFTLDPPGVIGQGDHRPLNGTTRSFYLACLRDARLTGRSEVVQSGGTWLLDVQPTEAALLDDEIEFDSQVFSGNLNGCYLIDSGDRRATLELDEAFHLIGAHTDFFGHWMWEYLPRFIAAQSSGLLPPVPILIDAHMPKSHRQSLELMFGDRAAIFEIPAFETVSVGRLWCAPNLMYMPLHENMNARFKWDYLAPCPERFAPVVREMGRRADAVPGEAAGPARVFLARKAFRHRKLVNSDSIEALAERHGFVIVHPEDLDFADQLRLIRHAKYIVAPEGSALFLACFGRETAKLCILNHPFTEALPIYGALLAGKHIEIAVVTGPAVSLHSELRHYADYRIDEPVFQQFLHKWLGNA